MIVRRCPRCTFTLVPHQVTTAELDACPRCRGVFVEQHEGPGVLGPFQDVASWAAAGVAQPLGMSALPCPSDDVHKSHGRMTAWRVALPAGDSIEVDTCVRCRGLWLDAGEAQRLMARAPAPAARATAPAASSPTEPAAPGVGWYLFQLFTAMPLEVYNPKRRAAVVCLTLVLACIAVFAMEVAAVSSGDEAFILRWSAVGKELLAGRQLPSVVTHMFLHGGIAHLLGNMWFLWTFGDNVEDRVGRGRFLALYLVFGVAGMALQLALMENLAVPLLGASGAIAGLMGAYLALFPRARLYQVIFFLRLRVPVWLYIGGWAAMNIVLGLFELNHLGPETGVAWWAHVGGFFAGLSWGLLFGSAYKDGAELRR